MGFTEKKIDEATLKQWELELRKNGRVELHTGETPKPERFWLIRLLAAILIPGILLLPIIIYTIVVNMLKKKKSVKGQVILITGAARGLGREMSIKFAQLGAKVACVDINTQGVEETAEMIRAAGGRAAAFTTNIAKPDKVSQLKKEVEKALGPVDILINNAAIVSGDRVSEWEDDDIRAFYDVNILSHLWTIKTFLPTMRQRKSGQIVTMSSGAALMACPFLSMYGSSKAAVTSLANNLREEMEMLNEPIKFTTLHPIFINTSKEIADFCNVRFPIMDLETATNSIIDAILLEKENVSLPSPLWTIAAIDNIMPKLVHQLGMYILAPTVSLPDKRFRKACLAIIVEDTLNKKIKT